MADLNIYSANLQGGLLGWATFPKSTYSATDGVVVLNEVSRAGLRLPTTRATPPPTRSATGSGCYHTFQGGCAGGRLRGRHPAEASPAYGCPTGRDTCSGGGADPIRNFMDYTDDACMNTFTTGQRTRMQQSWTAYRA